MIVPISAVLFAAVRAYPQYLFPLVRPARYFAAVFSEVNRLPFTLMHFTNGNRNNFSRALNNPSNLDFVVSTKVLERFPGLDFGK